MECPWKNSPHNDLIERLIIDYKENYPKWRHTKQSSFDISYEVYCESKNTLYDLNNEENLYRYVLSRTSAISKYPGEIYDVISVLLRHPDSVYMLSCDISELVLLSRLGSVPATLLYVGADAIKRTGFKVNQSEEN